MSTKATGGTARELPPLLFDPIPKIDTYELGDEGWEQWDLAVRSLDRTSLSALNHSDRPQR